jgi:PIN domain nuclease of toxin-antitoxin system
VGIGQVKLLLDTHIWLWSALEPYRLSRRVARELADQENELWLSPISVWELTVLQRKGRLDEPKNLSAWVAESAKDLELIEAPITIDVALAVASIDFPHGDPGDHLLAASAKVFDLTLVTADENLMELAEISVLANR